MIKKKQHKANTSDSQAAKRRTQGTETANDEDIVTKSIATRQYALLKCKNDITMRILETQEERKVKALREKDAMKQERDIALKEAAAANKERDIVMREVTDTVIQQKI